MNTSSSTPKSSKKSVSNSKETPARKVIKLPYNENNLFVPADQLRKVPRLEDDQYVAGDLVWVKTKGFPWWPCLITVDPETGNYSKIVVIRDKNDKAFHVQYFGSRPFRGYTQGNIMIYEGKEKYELKLDQIKNTPTANKSQRKVELSNYEIKHKFKKDWSLASNQADDAMKLDRAKRIETLTFEYVLDRPKSTVKKSDEETQPSISSMTKSSNTKKRKAETQHSILVSKRASQSASKLFTTPSTKRKKKSSNETKSSPTDVYDFNEFADEFQEDVTPSKPFELSSAKRAKGEYSVYAKQSRSQIEKENPDLDEDEVEAKLKRNWELMSDDMRAKYAPRVSLFQNLSFQIDSPHHDRSLNDADISSVPIPDLNNSVIAKSSSKKKKITEKKIVTEPKTYGGRRSRSRAKEEKTTCETNAFDEKENAVDSEDLDTEDAVLEENEKGESVVSTNKRSSRKKVFNQGNETNETTNENTANNTSKRQSARMRARRTSVELDKTKSASRPTKSLSVKSTSSTKVSTPSTRSSRRLSAANGDGLAPVATIKSNSINSKKEIETNNQLVLGDETNGISEDSVSCSSESEKLESEKTEQHKDVSEESKEKTCSKCLESDKGLIKCDGECLSHYHKECLHQTS